MQYLLRRLLARGRGFGVHPRKTSGASAIGYNGGASAAGEEAEPRAGGEVAVPEALAAAERERSALESRLAAAADETAALRREAAEWRAQLYRSERMLIDELDRLAQSAIAAAAPDPGADAGAPAVSAVMPVYNRTELLVFAVKSVLAQSFRRWELIVVDDGSTDDIAGALRPLLADPRIRLVRQDNGGECSARNHALRLARGELVAYLDSDNFWYPAFLAAAAQAFGADPDLDIAYGGIAYDWPNGDARFYLLPFDRAALLRDNLCDLNVIVHRRRAYERFGGFDEGLNRAVEWDLMLRYTVERPAGHIPVLGARYRIVDKNRASARRPLHNDTFRIRRKWWPSPKTPPRALLAVPEVPQASVSPVAAAIACMRRFGAHIEVWASAPGGAPAADDVPIHRGALRNAIVSARPDLVHVEGFALAAEQKEALAACGLPLTLRSRGSETAPDALGAALALPNLVRAYVPPATAPADPRVRGLAPFFDTTLFAPAAGKDRRLVLRAAPALPENDLCFMLDLAKLLPGHRVVVAAARVSGHEDAIEALRAYRAEIGSPAEIRPDVPRAELARLFASAGIYVHSALPAETSARPRARGPASLVEAMATGAYVLARKAVPFAPLIGRDGGLYGDLAEAAALIRATEAWTDAQWRDAEIRAIDRAFAYHPDEIVLRPMFDDWCAIAGGPKRIAVGS